MSKKSYLYFAVFCLSISVIYFSESKRYNERYGYADELQEQTEEENPILIANDAWSLFAGSHGYVDEKQALELAQKSIQLVGEQGNKRLLSVLENNLLVIYSCSFNPEVRDIQAGRKVPNNFSDARTKDNLIWSIFLRQINSNVDISKEFHDALISENPLHPVAKYMEYLDGKLPESSEQAYELLAASAKNGDADAAMRIGFKYECGFEFIDADAAIQWYSDARAIYLAEKKFSQAISSLERINRLKMLKHPQKLV